MSLDELMAIKVDTVQGASKREQTTTEAPSSVSIVTQDDIRKNGHRTLSDVLNRVRGFYVSYDRGYSFLGSRGFNRPGDYGSRFLLMVDGHRLNDSIYDSAAAGTDFPLDIDLIDRVEIIRGPGSSLYGNNALFGVINIITRRGGAVGGAEVAGSYASFETWTGRATYGRHFTNGVEFLVSTTLADSAGADRLRFPEFEARDLDGGWFGNGFASLAYHDFTLRGGFSRRQKDWPTAAYGTVPDSHDPPLTSIDERAWADLRFEHEFGDEWQVAGRGYFDRYRYHGTYPYDYDEDPRTRPDENRDLVGATSAGLEFSVSKQLWEDHRFITGGEWRHDFELIQRNWDTNPETEFLNSDENADILGVFLQDEWSLRPNLLMNAGARLDHYSVFGNTVNPRASVIYTPWEPSTFKFLYGQAFRAPNAYEIYYVGTGHISNPDLQPETVRSYEIVWEQKLGPRWRTTFSAFWNDVDDLIDSQIDPGADPTTPDDDVIHFDNVGAASLRGVEFEAEGLLPAGLRAQAAYTLADTENSLTGAELENAPRHLGKFNLSAPVWREKVFASLELLAMSSRRTLQGERSGAYAVVNFTLFSREIAKGLELSASLYNLLDQRYSHPVSGDFHYTGPSSGTPIALESVEQDGRTFRVKLLYRF